MEIKNWTGTRVRVSGKFFRVGADKWYARGFCYGPFAANVDGDFVPEPRQVRADFAHMSRLGATCLRTYFPPPAWLLDTALESGLHILVDVPWEKHRCFFEDWTSQEQARDAVRKTASTLGRSAAVFAISVANELPNDVVRFYGARRIQRFLDELLDIVHQEAPECLATYANFPTTEFLQLSQQDFCCFNVYLHDSKALGNYLDRLQHLAGTMPLVISEYGIDALRHGEDEQALRLVDFGRTAFRHGAAGSFVFSFTDDWFTGGHQIENWAFGVTNRDRSDKAAATCLARIWNDLPQTVMSSELPKVSVVVCSYNGGATLRECLHSLMKLNYPDYEVILVDDGSQDDTPAIAADFPQVTYIRQANKGLSAARNVGLEAAHGEIVAYTDSDCVADDDWLSYLAHGMLEQQVDAIGGPNLTPSSDNSVAKCVAASPGNPSHVMFDDQCAEHVPGCNMAFRRSTLLSIDAFDPQFRQAGDDVDICWRLLEQGYRIGYAAAAMVWHHRRCTVSAYYQQQKGYGRAEAMLAFKHPQRFAAMGSLRFDGVIYGDGKAGLPLVPARVYHGRFGSALFQTIYQSRDFRFHARATSLEWHCVSAFILALSTMLPPLAIVSIAMWLATLGSVAANVREIPQFDKYQKWCGFLVFWLHLSQPIVRGLHRNGYCLRNKRLPKALGNESNQESMIRQISRSERELYWETTNGHGREELLDELVAGAQENGWPGDYYGGWVSWDIELFADLWHHVTVRTATEELGWLRRFTRARWTTKATRLTYAVAAGACIWSVLALITSAPWAMILGLGCCGLLLERISQSRTRCLRAVGQLIGEAAKDAGLVSQEFEDKIRVIEHTNFAAQHATATQQQRTPLRIDPAPGKPTATPVEV
jgi:O-antigen biosynthesis protein